MFFSVAMLLLATACSNQYDPEQQISNTSDIKSDISPEDARQELEALLDDVYGKQSTRADEHGGKTIISASTFKEGRPGNTRSASHDSLTYHVFNFANNGGYAIMSGDSEMPSLIALTNAGSFTGTGNTGNPGVDFYFHGMGDFNGKNPFDPTSGLDSGYSIKYGDWTNTVYKPGGYCSVTWNQRWPYNYYCPKIDGGTPPTGCVATAVAQIMAVYKFPSSYNGYTFNWNAMTAFSFGSQCTSIGQDNIARLMQQLGLPNNLNMKYALEGSEAYTKDVPRTFRNFGYQSGGNVINYDTDKIVSELQNGYPIYVRGATTIVDVNNTSKKVGHGWICHGLLKRSRDVKKFSSSGVLLDQTVETLWYPLCNWGWGGLDDGYFLSGVFDTQVGATFDKNGNTTNTSGGNIYNFKYDIKAVINIRK